MEFELKKIKLMETLSEETPCFSAEIWEAGKRVAYVSNDGHGGSNLVRPAEGLKYEEIAKYDNMDVEVDIFTMLYNDADRKKYQSKNFVLIKENNIYTVKFPMSITTLKKYDDYQAWKDRYLNKFKSEGYTVLNTNL